MSVVNMYDAKTQLSRLVDEAAAGGEVIIARNGKPVVRLVPVGQPAGKRKLGRFDGKATIPDDFDAPLPDDVLAAFEGR